MKTPAVTCLARTRTPSGVLVQLDRLVTAFDPHYRITRSAPGLVTTEFFTTYKAALPKYLVEAQCST